jgi:hypothetical protein
MPTFALQNLNYMNKETLEEAAEKYAKTAEGIDIPYQNGLYYGFVEGAKWQAERMYSEEDMRECWRACLNFNKPSGLDSGINYSDFINSLNKQDK